MTAGLRITTTPTVPTHQCPHNGHTSIYETLCPGNWIEIRNYVSILRSKTIQPFKYFAKLKCMKMQ